MGTKGGSGSRARTKLRRKAEKRKLRDLRKARYIQESLDGKVKGRHVLKKKAVKLVNMLKSHVKGATCGNRACRRCYEITFESFLKDGKPFRMPQWMYAKWERRSA